MSLKHKQYRQYSVFHSKSIKKTLNSGVKMVKYVKKVTDKPIKSKKYKSVNSVFRKR